jgi:hypothetical protein
MKDSKLLADCPRGNEILTIECMRGDRFKCNNGAHIMPLSIQGFVITKLMEKGLTYDEATDVALNPKPLKK